MVAVYIRACQTAFFPHNQANDKLNLWNHTVVPQSYNLSVKTIMIFWRSVVISISNGISSNIFASPNKQTQCSHKRGFIKKNHLYRFIHKTFGSYNREVYSKNASEHYLSDRLHTKIEMDSNYPVPTWVSSHLNSGQVSQMYCDNLVNVRYQKRRHSVHLNW